MPAAGPPVKDAKFMKQCIEGGCGGIVAKTISQQPAVVPRPCMIYREHNSMLNHELWSDMPWQEWLGKEYQEVKKAYPNVPFIGSAGYNKEDIGFLAPKMVEAGADILELSIHYLGSDPTFMEESIKAAIRATGGKVPVFPKLSPNIPDIKEFARRAQAAGASGIVAINSVGPCLGIDVETGMPVTGGPNGYGWLSGEAVKPMALRCVFEIASAVDIPVIAVGGISSGLDAVEFIMAGASAVQVCTAAIYKGNSIYGKIAKEIEQFMVRKGYNTINDFKGLALKNNKLRKDKYLNPSVPVLLSEKCRKCGDCVKACIYGAVSMEKGKFPTFDPELCYGCGLCKSKCKYGALTQNFWK